MNNPFQIQSSTNVTNGDGDGEDDTNYSGGATGGAGLPSWSTVVKPLTTSCLIRQSSSPPAFLHQHLTSDFGITHPRGGENYNQPQSSILNHKHKQSRLSSDRLSFTKHDSIDVSTPNSSRGFTISPWEECNSIAFDAAAYNPQVKDLSEIGTIDKYNVPAENSVAWRIRAKRGFATDPRSIAERERRTKINCKLKKLQELLPNTDNQTSYAEMLDLAVEHVKGLQFRIQELNEELDSCTCGSKHNSRRSNSIPREGC